MPYPILSYPSMYVCSIHTYATLRYLTWMEHKLKINKVVYHIKAEENLICVRMIE